MSRPPRCPPEPPRAPPHEAHMRMRAPCAQAHPYGSAPLLGFGAAWQLWGYAGGVLGACGAI
eukprot:2982168-Prymnesium_polylepis.1